jgi:putative Holliday junction resolvase
VGLAAAPASFKGGDRQSAAASRSSQQKLSHGRFGDGRLPVHKARTLALLDLSQFIDALPPQGAVMGLDPGEKRIGVAVSDTGRMIASSLETVTRKKFSLDAEHILKLFDHRQCVGFVIGLPLNMDGSAGPSAQSARAFARNLIAMRDVPLLLWDERLSTAAVTRTLIEGDASRRRRGEVVDKMAAAYMLQGAIDAMQERKLP